MYWTNTKELIAQHRLYFVGFALWLVVLFFLQIQFTQNQLSIAVNRIHTPWLDVLCKYGTHIGDGLFAAALALLILWKKREYFIWAILCFYTPALFTQLLKHTIFASHLRPIMHIGQTPNLHVVDGLTIHQFNSFPSGHSTSAFAVFLFLHFITPNKRLGILFFALAVFAAFTRVYLVQHFTKDVYAGSIIGTAFTLFLFAAYQPKNNA